MMSVTLQKKSCWHSLCDLHHSSRWQLGAPPAALASVEAPDVAARSDRRHAVLLNALQRSSSYAQQLQRLQQLRLLLLLGTRWVLSLRHQLQQAWQCPLSWCLLVLRAQAPPRCRR